MTDALHLTPREVAQVEAELDDGTDGVRCGCGRFVPCRHCRASEPTPEQLERLSRTPARPWNPPLVPQSRLERDLSDFHVDLVSEHPPPEFVALAADYTTAVALRAVQREDEDDD